MNIYLVKIDGGKLPRPEPDYWHVERAENAQKAIHRTRIWFIDRGWLNALEEGDYAIDVCRADEGPPGPFDVYHVSGQMAFLEGVFTVAENACDYADELRSKLRARVEVRRPA